MTTEAPATAPSSPPAGFDGRPELREFVFEQLGLLQRQAEIAQMFAEAGDDVGLRYALTRVRAHWRATLESFNELAAADRGLKGGTNCPPSEAVSTQVVSKQMVEAHA